MQQIALISLIRTLIQQIPLIPLIRTLMQQIAQITQIALHPSACQE
jgi:hypothetical protein